MITHRNGQSRAEAGKTGIEAVVAGTTMTTLKKDQPRNVNGMMMYVQNGTGKITERVGELIE